MTPDLGRAPVRASKTVSSWRVACLTRPTLVPPWPAMNQSDYDGFGGWSEILGAWDGRNVGITRCSRSGTPAGLHAGLAEPGAGWRC